jgi:hypothetical protein
MVGPELLVDPVMAACVEKVDVDVCQRREERV